MKQALEDSLRRLGTDRVDLYQLHWPDPPPRSLTLLAPFPTWSKRARCARSGARTFLPPSCEEAEAAAAQGAPRFVSVQNEYSLLNREPELGVLDECEKLGIAFIPYSRSCQRPAIREVPPRRAALRRDPDRRHAGRTPAGMLSDSQFDVIEALERFARITATAILELAIAWLAAKPAVASVIAGATKPEQCWANVKAADWVLTEEEVQEVDAIVPAPTASARSFPAAVGWSAPLDGKVSSLQPVPLSRSGAQLRIGSNGLRLSTSWRGFSIARRPSCWPTVPSATIWAPVSTPGTSRRVKTSVIEPVRSTSVQLST